jgi:hypothetical protein
MKKAKITIFSPFISLNSRRKLRFSNALLVPLIDFILNINDKQIFAVLWVVALMWFYSKLSTRLAKFSQVLFLMKHGGI